MITQTYLNCRRKYESCMEENVLLKAALEIGAQELRESSYIPMSDRREEIIEDWIRQAKEKLR